MENPDFVTRSFPSIATIIVVGAMSCALSQCSASETVAIRGATTKTTGAAGSSDSGGSSGGGGSGGSGGSTATGGSGGGGSGGGGGQGGAGGAGAAAGTSSGGRGGTAMPPPRDASSDISFDWPEGPVKNPCKAGVYQGTFACTYSPGDAGVGLFPVSGPISLKMVQSQNGEFLEVREGLLDGTANIFFTFRANISGKLDCKTQKFDGKLENGVYSGFLVINGTFQGPLSSDYDRVASQFSNGAWSLVVDMGNGGCNGTWSAAYQGPGD